VKTLVTPTALVVMVAGLMTAAWTGQEADTAERIRRVEAGLRRFQTEGMVPRPVGDRLTLAERMAHYRVPGVSIAVIDDFEIAWVRGYGLRRAGGSDSVTPATLFQAASMGKPVAAVAALSVVQRGGLDLDADVNSQLRSWHIPENEMTAQRAVTLRQLLSHNAGATVHGFGGYARGSVLPTLQQILRGELPANNDPILVDAVPGTGWSYSGGGYMIVQQLIEDVTAQPFATALTRTVLGPTGMTSSLYAAPLPDSLAAVAALAHDEAGQPARGGWRDLVCYGAGGGLWTTPRDLARLVVDLLRTYAGRGQGILSRETVQAMFTPEVTVDDHFSMGLGFMLEGEGESLTILHGGDNPPGYQGILVAVPARGQGAVIMTNGRRGQELAAEIMFAIEAEYRWPNAS
jgi:CubicO group peptidase (beta-lactamase class C family)